MRLYGVSSNQSEVWFSHFPLVISFCFIFFHGDNYETGLFTYWKSGIN